MTARGFVSVAIVECTKLAAQARVRLVMAACVLGPFAFAAVIRLQSSLPEDTLFGRSARESGFAIPLVVLGFAALWAVPVLAAIAGGDLFSAEDRYGTWATLLTRSRSRSELFAGKLVIALAFCCMAVMVLAVSSIASGALIVGTQPIVDLSGVQLPPEEALKRVTIAWMSALPPAFGFTALAVLVSVWSRSGIAGITLPVSAGLAMQLVALVDGPELPRRLLITSAFGAWHGLLTSPRYLDPLMHGVLVSASYFVLCVSLAYRQMWRRDIG